MAEAPRDLGSLAPEKLAFLFHRLKRQARDPLGDLGPRRGGAGGIHPLSFAQERLWFLDRLGSGSLEYDVAGAIDLTGPLDWPALVRGLEEVVARHEVLRSTFRVDDGEPVQVVGGRRSVRVPLVDFGALPKAGRERGVEALTRALSRHRFDLATGPILIAACIRSGSQDHRLLLVLHHIVADARSVDVLLEELAGHYGAFADGASRTPLAPLELQYGDYARWQRERLEGEALRTALEAWRDRLAGLEALVLRGDRPPPQARSGLGGRCHFTVGEPVARALNALCQEYRATPFAALLAVFGAFLARYGGETDVAVAAPTGLRERPELEALVGFFVNTLVLRVDHSGDPRFDELLVRAREAVAAAFRHQDVPFEKVVQAVAPERVAGANPLARVMLSLESEPRERSVGGLGLRPRAVDNGTAKLDLLLAVRPVAGRLEGYLEYSADLFDRSTVRRMAGQVCNLIAAATARPRARTSQLGLLSPGERHQVVYEWNDRASGRSAPRSIPSRFRAQAGRISEAVAAVDGGAHLSYGELHRRAERMARVLRARGVRPEERVGVCLPRSLDLLASTLGVMAAGGAYVPLDPDYPRERLAAMMRDSGARVAISRTSCWPEGLEAGDALLLDRESTLAAGPPAPDERTGEPEPSREALAYVIYTSGSTGRPKGVGIRHGSAATFLDWALGAFSDDELSGVLASTSICFDLSVFELFAPLAAGGCVVLSGSALELPSLPARERVRLINTVPSVAAELLRMGPLPSSVRTVNLAGEPLSRALASTVLAEPGVARLLNLYGPTEDTTYSTWTAVPAGAAAPTIGRPLSETRASVVDASLLAQPIGAPGELVLAGSGLARGYLGRPGLTAERFVPEPSSRVTGGRLYRTGDLARRLPGGEIELLGRLDHQVKVRGFRIELGEVEAALARVPGVRAAAAGVWEPAPGDRRLVAYLVSEPGRSHGVGELREGLAPRLPAFLIPSEVVALDDLPRTPNGKLDRRALPLPDPRKAPARSSAPRTPTEAVVAEVCAGVLGIDRVGVDESFFELGGHSLLATRLVSRLNGALGCALSVRAVFEAPTVAGLARLAERTAGAAPRPVVERLDRRGPSRLSSAQERLWFLDRMDPGGAAYNLPTTLRLSGPLDFAALGHAFTVLERRQEALRTVFTEVGGRPAQVVLPPSPPRLPVVDLSALPARRREAEARRRLEAAAARGFDLETGPLLDLLLLRLGGAEAVLSLNVHHVAADGWSLGVILREVSALYAARRHDRPAELPELSIQYADFAAWQARRASTPELRAHLEYWRRKLAGAPAELTLPLDRPRPRVPGLRGERCSALLDADRVRELTDLGRARGATLFMTLLAAFAALLGRLAGQDDVVVGTPVAGRDLPEVEDLVGMFLNSLALRIDLSGDPTFEDLLARVRETALEAYVHREVPFERLLSEIGVERDLSRTPLFQVFFNLFNFPLGEAGLEGLDVEVLTPPRSPAKFDLTVYLEQRAGGLGVDVVYNADLFDRARIEEMLAQLHLLLDRAVGEPASRVRDVSLVSDRSGARLPDPTRPLASRWEGGVPAAFGRHARQAPDRVAGVDFRGAVSYGSVDRWSLDTATWLASQGVGRGDVVAVFAHRSAALLWAVLGVMRSGAAFLLLDPEHPAPRLVSCLRQVAVRAWLELDEAGPLPPELAGFLDELPDLPRRSLAPRPAAAPTGKPAGETVDADRWREPELGPDDLACVGFTSGSTGVPKGVLGRHGPLAHFTPWQCREFDLGADDRFSGLSGLSHDPLQRDLFTPLQIGAAVVLPAPDDLLDAGRLAPALARQRITVSHLTPALGQLLCQAPAGTRLDDLRAAFLVGDVLTRRDVDRLAGLAPAVSCVNFFGATETQRAVGYLRAREGRGDAAEVLPLGRGIEDVQLLVVTAAGRLAGVGEVGEIWVRSPHLAAGYLGDPELTRSRFVPNPFTGEPRDRVYRTGDLGRFLPGGDVVFVGRADRQVKVRGFRVELGEVEATVGRHPAVREVVVIERRDAGREAYLAAYVVPREGMAVAGEELRAWARDRLPAAMVPPVFVELTQIPLTPNRKVDRIALPLPGRGLPERTAVAPRTPTEALVLGVWREVLGVAEVGVEDDFFALGGHSLRATQAIARLRSLLGVEVPVRRLFEAPTVAALASALDRADGGLAASGVPALVSVSRPEGAVPLSFAQERMWFLDRLDPGSGSYNLCQAVRLRGRLHLPALLRAVAEPVRRHESLRTRFLDDGGEPRAVLGSVTVRPPGVVDLSFLPVGLRDGEALRVAAREALRPFDLASGELLRAVLLRLAGEEHLLLAVVHHVACDGWSMELLMREVATVYGAFARGLPSPLRPQPVQYGDFASWQRAWLRGEVVDEKLRFWSRNLAAAPAALPLPTDRPRPAVRGHRGGLVSASWSKEITASLRALARRRGSTLYMVVLAALDGLLARSTGEEDVSVGAPVAGRSHPEVEELIGLFVNTLVLRTDLRGDPSFVELLDRVRTVCLAAYRHQDLPFEKVVERLAPDRTLSRSPLFQVLFVLHNVPRRRAPVAGLTLEPVELDRRAPKLDLAFAAVEDGERLGITLEYDAEIFDRTTAVRMLRHLERALHHAVSAPEARLSSLPLLGAAERTQIRSQWNDTATAPAAAGTLPELFARQAASTPDAVAVTSGGAALSYRELAARAAGLARELRRRGVGPDAVVAVAVERSLELAVALVGVLEAGGAYLPLDPALPSERLRYMLDDAGVGVLVTAGDGDRGVPGGGHATLRIGGPAPADPHEPSPRRRLDPDHLAYVIYTSGSTGRPKGVMSRHGSIVNRLLWMVGTLPVGSGERVLQKTPVTFDVSVWELFAPLVSGGCVVMARPGGHRDSRYLARVLRRERITTVHFVPSMLEAFLAEESFDGAGDLGRVIASGEALTPDLVRSFHRAAPARTALYNLYGPTETAVEVLAWRCSREPGLGAVSLGRPIANTSARILDRWGREAAIGVAGELAIGGVSLARGYLGRPALTAARFVPDPGPSETGSRLYLTGDLARRSATGEIEFLGRLDHQVKLRGVRIELGEIESVLRDLPSVRDAVVTVRGEGERRSLIAYLVGGGVAAPRPTALRERLVEKLPDYMVPARFVVLDRFPLTASGKVDRNALPDPGDEGAPGAGAAPTTVTEELLAEIWAGVLGVESPAVTDDFFSLGGHSLLATRAVSRIERAFGVELPLRDLFEAPTVRALAARIDRRSGRGRPILPIRPEAAEAQGPVPLSFAQQRLWFLDRLVQGASPYNVPLAFRVRGRLDVGALARSLGEIERRHAVLRTVFVESGDEPAQRILPPARFRLAVVDLSAIPDARRAALVSARVEAEAERPFDLERGPVWRGVLLRLGDGNWVAQVTLHHIVSDGWSLGVLVEELGALYPAFAAGDAHGFEAPAVQYADFALWQRRHLDAEARERGVAYWRGLLAGAPPVVDLPLDRPRTARADHGGAAVSVDLGAEEAQGLRALCRAAATTRFMALLAGFQVTLHTFSGAEDVVVGTDVANRTLPETEKLIGFFVNQLVLRTDLAGNPSLRQVLERVRETVLEAFNHQEVPFEMLVERLRPERSLVHAPLFQVKLNLQNATAGALDLPGLELEPLPVSPRAAKLDMIVDVADVADRLRAVCRYSVELFDEATARRVVERYREVLVTMAARPELRLSELRREILETEGAARRASRDQFRRAGKSLLRSTRHELAAAGGVAAARRGEG